MRNSVDAAIAARDSLLARGVPARLLHARFALCERKRIEAEVLATVGKTGEGRAGFVLVGTQVLESAFTPVDRKLKDRAAQVFVEHARLAEDAPARRSIDRLRGIGGGACAAGSSKCGLGSCRRLFRENPRDDPGSGSGGV
ncbi:hypothetical protein [Rhodobacter capsulatus]|uniref:hypothetical protein n=1 Tax=Rhodobacter capsulatus TaxID=1061 RepID=UPI00373FDECF